MNGSINENRKGIPYSSVELKMIGSIARWCESIHGYGDLVEALEIKANCIGAEAVALTRVARDPVGGSRSLIYDMKNARSAIYPLQRSYARAILGDYFDQSKAGSVWFMSMIDGDTDPSLTKLHQQRRFSELAIIPLATNEKSLDFLEFHFPEQLSQSTYAILNLVSNTLSETWKNRRPGLIADQMMRNRNAAIQENLAIPILGYENPAKLSRAEYRVCVMLSQCLTTKQIASELSITFSTLRTHLRHIYQKTNVNSQAELTHHLLTMRQPAQAQMTARIA